MRLRCGCCCVLISLHLAPVLIINTPPHPLTPPNSAFHKRERVWALRLLRDALRTSQDLSLLHRRHGPALLLGFLDAALHRPQGGGIPADPLVVSVGLEVLSAAAALPRGPGLLLRQGGLLAWTAGVVAAALQQLPPPPSSQAGHYHRDQGVLPKRTVGVLQSVVALARRALRGFAAAPPQHQHQHQKHAQAEGDGHPPAPVHAHHGGQPSSGVADQARALVPLLLLLLHRGLLPPMRPPRATTTTTTGAAATTTVRHTPAAILALAGDVLDLLLLLQQPGAGLLPSGLGLRVPQQALGLIEAVGAVATPPPVREGLARAALTLVVREAEAAAAATAVGEEEEEEAAAAPEVVAALVEWVATHTAGLLLQRQRAPGDGGDPQPALVTAAAAGRLTLRLLERHGAPVVSQLCGEQRRFWPWALAGLLSCPVFLPGSLSLSGGSDDAAGAPQRDTKRAWVAVSLHLLEAKRGGLRAFVGELRAALDDAGRGDEQVAAAAAMIVVDVVASATRALLGEEDDHDQGRIEALRRETRAALAPFVRSAPAVSPVGGGGSGKKKRPSSSAAAAAGAGLEGEKRGGKGSSKKQKRKK